LFYFRSETGKDFLKACDIVHEMSEKFILERKLENKKDGKNRKCFSDFLDILLQAKDENGIGLSDDSIRAEIDTFLFEGHDTTASAITWSLYCFAKYPKYQIECLKEIKEVVDDNEDIKWLKHQQIYIFTTSKFSFKVSTFYVFFFKSIYKRNFENLSISPNH